MSAKKFGLTFAVRLSCAALILALPAVSVWAQHNTSNAGKSHTLATTADSSHKDHGAGAKVAPGSDTEAKAYYDRIEQLLGVSLIENGNEPPSAVSATTLNGMLVYLGYQNNSGQGLKASHLEDIDSFVLMPGDAEEFKRLDFQSAELIGTYLSLADFHVASGPQPVLVSRFFAPKIAKYFNEGAQAQFEPVDTDAIVPGWRKVVRLIPRKGSAAESKVKYAYILFNFKKANADVDPFAGNTSANNQVILVSKEYDPKTKDKDAVYFAVYQSRETYQLGLFLGADFDLPGHVAYQGPLGVLAKDSEYFVPTACAACHGHGDTHGEPIDGVFSLAKPNYFDTDQWYDWMEFDFRGVSGSLNDVLFDGGKDHSSPAYKRAVNVVANLNEEVKVDTLATGEEFSLSAVQKWLDLHGVTDGVAAAPDRKPYSLRAHQSVADGGWNPNDPKQMRLLRLLDNHCFRCHSSMLYNVFDKAAVGSRKKLIKDKIKEVHFDGANKPLPGFTMPQGRVLPGATRIELDALINEIFPGESLTVAPGVKAVLGIVARNYAFLIDGKDNPTINLTAGQSVSISLTSAGGIHDWYLEDSFGNVIKKTATVSGSTPVTLTFTAPAAGKYAYYCAVGSHRKLGMEGVLLVRPPASPQN